MSSHRVSFCASTPKNFNDTTALKSLGIDLVVPSPMTHLTVRWVPDNGRV